VSDQQPAAPLRPLGAGEILDASIKVVRRDFKTLALCVLVVAVPLGILDTLIQASTNDAAFDYSLDAETGTEFDGAAIGGTLASALIAFLLAAVTTAACFRAIGAAYLGSPTTWQESLRFAVRRLPSVLWVLVLATLVTLAGFVALIIPGIYLGVALYFSQPALLFEDLKGRRALGRSYDLVKGRWWQTFLVVLVGSILVAVVQGAFVLVLGVGLALTEPSLVVAAVLTTIVTIAAYTLSYPIQAAIVALTYFDLRVRKEGFDLYLLAQRIGAGPAVSPPIAQIGYGPPADAPTGRWPPPPPSPGPPPPAPPDEPTASGFLPPRPPQQ
jgi:hypothetical protein